MTVGDVYWVENYEARVERVENAHCLLSSVNGDLTFWRGKEYVEHHLLITPVVKAMIEGGVLFLVIGPNRARAALDLVADWCGRPGAPFTDLVYATPRLDGDALTFDGTGHDPFVAVELGGVVIVVPECGDVPADVRGKFDHVIEAT